jgi:hypothetical protein
MVARAPLDHACRQAGLSLALFSEVRTMKTLKTMESRYSRRSFVRTTSGGIVLMATPWGALAQPAPQTQPPQAPTQAAPPGPPPKRPDPLAAPTVEEFVRVAHKDLAATKAMLTEQPRLLNATWDWGAGDFETGVGGAGHMGNREIAEYLIGEGARLDIFVAAMLGKMDIVKALLTAWPGLVHSKGPHGISLLRHAKAGGEASAPVLAYLTSLGAA